MFLDSAQQAAGNDFSGLFSLLIIPFLFVIMYFFIIRPQKKQEKEAAAMRDSLSVGDEVTTIGGIIGRVINVKEDTFVLETTRDRTKIRFERSAIKRIDRKFDAPVVSEAPAQEADENKEENK